MDIARGWSLVPARNEVLAAAFAAVILSVAPLMAQTPGIREAGPPAPPSASVDFSQVTRPVVEITDSATIEFLLFELFLAPVGEPDRLEVVDVTQNGFGPDDIIIVYPSVEAFLIPEFVPEGVLALMGGWVPRVEYRMDSGNVPADALAALVESEGDPSKHAESALMYDVVQAVGRSYADLPVSMLFQRDSVGFTFQLWDYNDGEMRYAPRAAFETGAQVSEVVDLLRDVGYVPGEGRVGLGRSLASIGAEVAPANRAILGIATLPDLNTRMLAARTVLLGSFDYDRSGAIDGAREVDAPTCAVWSSLEEVFPNFLGAFGFDDPAAPYAGNVAFAVHRNVRAPAAARARACLSGEDPPDTDPAAVVQPEPDAIVQPAVATFSGLDAAAEIVRRAGPLGGGSAGWMREVRGVLVSRYDHDRSGLLDVVTEVLAVPCEAWSAVESTHGGFGDAWRAGEAFFAEEIGVATAFRGEARARVQQCGQASTRTAFVVPTPPVGARALPPAAIREAVTVPLRALGSLEDEDGRFLPAKTVLLTMFDLDRSGGLDRRPEVDAIPCEVWRALDATFPGYAERFGFVQPAPDRPYRGHLTLSIAPELQQRAEGRITACLRGESLPAPGDQETSPTVSRGREISVPTELRRFLELDAAASVARTAGALQPGSAAWALTVRSTLVGHYDLDGSGMLDHPDEIESVPCVVWSTIEATHGSRLPTLAGSRAGGFLADELGLSVDQRRSADARLSACR